MNLDKLEVIQRFCELSSNVGMVKFKHQIPHDCFCGDNNITQGSFQFGEEVLEFITDAVNEKLKGDCFDKFNQSTENP